MSELKIVHNIDNGAGKHYLITGSDGDTCVCWEGEADYEAIRELRSRISELESQARWIPVSERLPGSFDDSCAVLINGKRVSCGGYSPRDGAWGGGWSVHALGGGNVVTHWMPLPEPPKEQK
jgi:hypothetical protein